ncbi:hypothetical protein EDB83DRAFT_302756 [Lactarius deliciosus]|nr:hypothetical protein EDB83DRAFT_302756 [Lactarius deliciosus]
MRATRLLCSLSLFAISHGCTTGCIPSGGPERPSPPNGLGYKNHESVQLTSGDALNVSGTSEPQQEQNPNQGNDNDGEGENNDSEHNDNDSEHNDNDSEHNDNDSEHNDNDSEHNDNDNEHNDNDSEHNDNDGEHNDNENNAAATAATTFAHPGARAIFEGSATGDGPYKCKKCGDAVLTVSVTWCPACLDPYPWLPRD